MDNLIERLKHAGGTSDNRLPGAYLYLAAADELEKMRTRLEELTNNPSRGIFCNFCKTTIYLRESMLSLPSPAHGEVHYHAMCFVTRRAEQAEAMLANAKCILEPIEWLRADEGDSVEILCDNPDPVSAEYSNGVIACGSWTDWEERRFNAETLTAALAAAAAAKHEATDRVKV